MNRSSFEEIDLARSFLKDIAVGDAVLFDKRELVTYVGIHAGSHGVVAMVRVGDDELLLSVHYSRLTKWRRNLHD